MRSVFSIVLGITLGVYLLSNTYHEWTSAGTITVFGRGIPDIVFSGNTVWMGATINGCMAVALMFGAAAFTLFDSKSDKLQSVGIPLVISVLVLLVANAGLYVFSYFFLNSSG